jgi:hypothetical protein
MNFWPFIMSWWHRITWYQHFGHFSEIPDCLISLGASLSTALAGSVINNFYLSIQ